MQDRPDKAIVLDAVARFLQEDLQPLVAAQDKGLGYRVLVAAHLISVVAAEVRSEAAHDAAQLARLRALLPDVVGVPDGPHEAIGYLEAALSQRLQQGAHHHDPAWGRAAWDHVRQTLREKLLVVNPRFDTAAHIGEVD